MPPRSGSRPPPPRSARQRHAGRPRSRARRAADQPPPSAGRPRPAPRRVDLAVRERLPTPNEPPAAAPRQARQRQPVPTPPAPSMQAHRAAHQTPRHEAAWPHRSPPGRAPRTRRPRPAATDRREQRSPRPRSRPLTPSDPIASWCASTPEVSPLQAGCCKASEPETRTARDPPRGPRAAACQIPSGGGWITSQPRPTRCRAGCRSDPPTSRPQTASAETRWRPTP